MAYRLQLILMMGLPILGFIFDIDGTLLDSNDAHAKCLQMALAHSGHSLEFQTIRREIGKGLDHLLPDLIEVDSESKEGKAIAEYKAECFEKVFPQIQPFSHATALIQTLHAQGYKLTIASSASKEDLKKFIEKLQIEPYLEKSASADDADASKPSPDLIREALKNLNLPPEQVCMVGDTPYDIIAAHRAQVKTIALRSGGWSDEDLGDAALILNDTSHLLRRLESGFKPL